MAQQNPGSGVKKSRRKTTWKYEDGSVGGTMEKHKIGPWMPKAKKKVTGSRPSPKVRKPRGNPR